MTEILDALLGAVQDSPLLLAFLVILAGIVWAIERLSGVDGPLTRAVRAWQERELRRLRRERAIQAEQREVQQEREDARVRELEVEVGWLENERADQRRRDRARDQYDRALALYLRQLLVAARRAGVRIDDPPDPPDLAPLYVDGDADGLPTVPVPPLNPTTEPIAGRRNSARGQVSPG